MMKSTHLMYIYPSDDQGVGWGWGCYKKAICLCKMKVAHKRSCARLFLASTMYFHICQGFADSDHDEVILTEINLKMLWTVSANCFC